MSMHKIPLTALELAGLTAHGLDIGIPSQLSDVFRQGIAWSQATREETAEEVKERETRRDSFIQAAEPLIKWMSENCHPHTMVTVDSTRATLYEGDMNHVTHEFLRD